MNDDSESARQNTVNDDSESARPSDRRKAGDQTLGGGRISMDSDVGLRLVYTSG